MRAYRAMVAGLLTVVFISPLNIAYAQDFDITQLRALGYGEDIAQFFSTGTRFLPGKQWVSLSVNGQRAQPQEVEFTADGELCLDRVMASRLTLKSEWFPAQGCVSLDQHIPLSTVTLLPAQGGVQITVPQSAFTSQAEGFRYGGNGLMMNYDIYHYSTRGGRSAATDASQLSVEYGANFSNWVLRSVDDFTHNSRYGSETRHQQAWLARGVPLLAAVFQAGELLTQTQRFSGLPINGVQLVSDSALTSALNNNNTPIIGSANDNATVEIWQNGRMLYRTRVASGPFALNNVSGLSPLSEVEVLVREESGSEKRFITRVDPLASGRLSVAPEYALAIGSWRNQPGMNSENHAAPLLTGAWGQGIGQRSRVDSSLLMAEAAQGSALRLSHKPLPALNLDTEVALSRTTVKSDNQQSHIQQGQLYSLAGSYQFAPWLNFTASGNWQSAGFFSPYTALVSQPYSQSEDSLGYYLASQLSSEDFGSLSTWYSASRGNGISNTYGVSWRKNIARATLNLSWQHSESQYWSADQPKGSGLVDRDRIMLNTTIPFGKAQSIGFSASRDSQTGSQSSIVYDHRVDDRFAYSLSRSNSRNTSNSRAYLRGKTDFARYNLSYQQQDEGRKNVTLGTKGSLALAKGQWLAHSQSIDDTWGVLLVPELAGVKVSGAGSGRTSNSGSVLLPSLSPWQESEIRLDTQNIPFDVQVGSVREKVRPARGSMLSLEIPTKINRALLLTVRDQNQQFIAYGSSVLNMSGQLTGIISDRGGLLLTDVNEKQALQIKLVNGGRCQLDYALPARWHPGREYEQGEARCLL